MNGRRPRPPIRSRRPSEPGPYALANGCAAYHGLAMTITPDAVPDSTPANRHPVRPYNSSYRGNPVPVVRRRGVLERHSQLPTGRHLQSFITSCGHNRATLIPVKKTSEHVSTFYLANPRRGGFQTRPWPPALAPTRHAPLSSLPRARRLCHPKTAAKGTLNRHVVSL